MNIEELHNIFLKCSSISIDTRKIESNSLFVAIKGENFDANTFAFDALEKGAAYAIIDNKDFYLNDKTILVENSIQSLQELANFHRNYLKIPILSITGSNGKTTTKELVYKVLSKKYNVKATVGNLNNHIGVPLTLLSFDKKTEIGIVEMGANHQKEIQQLCAIALPDYGYITNFGRAHLEGFGGEEGVIKAKTELYQFLKDNHKLAFINLQDKIQVQKSIGIDTFSFDISNQEGADVNITSVYADPFVCVEYSNSKIETNLIGIYNATNVIAAICVGKYFQISDDDITHALEEYTPQNNRSQFVEKGSNKVLMDAYNANPSSMKAAIDNFINLKSANKIVILGDMFELGNDSMAEHKTIISLLLKETNIKCFFVGKYFYANKINAPNLYFYETFDDFSQSIKEIHFNNNLILIKGSRGMALERCLDLI